MAAIGGLGRCRIAVAGAGTAGLAAAAFLADNGHDVTLFERFDEPRPVGAGLLLQPTGLACLSRLGVEQMVIGLGARIDRLWGETVTGRRVLDMGYADLTPGLFGVGIHRASLFAALKSATDQRGVHIVPATELVSTRVDASSRKRFIVDKAGRTHGPFDLVVDATGTRSTLRRVVPGRRKERPFSYSALWGVVPLPADWHAPHVLSQRYQGASIMIGVLPIGRLPDGEANLAAFFWSLRADAYDAWHAEGIDAWKDRVRRLWPDVAPLLDHVRSQADLARATYVDVTLPTTIAERLVVIGDAAHATSPQLGQGANLALADALHLARSLATSDVASGLVRYEQTRKQHVAFYQRASRWLTPFFQSDSRLAGAVRDLTFGPSGYVKFVRQQMVETLCGVKTGPFSRLDAEAWRTETAMTADEDTAPRDITRRGAVDTP